MRRPLLLLVLLGSLLAGCFGGVGVLTPPTDPPHLRAAKQAALWIAHSAVDSEHGAAWPADPEDPGSLTPSLYSGSAGVVLFLLELAGFSGDELADISGDEGALALARRGADQLLVELEQPGLDAGLYTGLAGIGVVLVEAAELLGDPRYRSGAERVVELLAQRAQRSQATEAASWNGVTDVIGGSAGIGLFLIEAAHRLDLPPALDLASAAGDGLLETALPAGPGLRWAMSADYPRNMPNFSHGTAGIAYFLATLARATDDPRYLDAALAGARYLQSIADTEGEACLIYHHDPGGEELHYLSWCHGPAGTARLFHRLHQITLKDEWSEWVDRSARAVLASGVPEQQTPGFWNNVSQCCGSAGLLDFFLSLYRTGGDPEHLAFAQRVAANTLERATSDELGLRWIQAEHRVQPELLVAQTGWMQGAAGIGHALLRLHLVKRGGDVAIRLPDTPW